MLISNSEKTPTTNQLLPMSTECPICADAYNKSTRAKVTCPWEGCHHACCKSCVRTYLTSTTKDPCCMNCSKPLDMTWIVDNLNRSFYNGDYKEHRSNLLLDRTMAQMAEAMPEVERRTQIQKQKDAVKAAQEAAREAAAAARQAAHDLWKLENKQTPAEARKFIMGCPRDGCRGFLSTQYKCGLCGYHTCKDCLKCKGHSAEEIEAHVCNPDDIATANLIRSTCKPCPSCGERISKIEGCDQMWCTSCKTAFSWRTGRVDTGVVHNPHFFQFQRNNANGGGGAPDHQVGLNQCNQEQLPYWYTFNRSVIRKITARKEADQIKNLYRTIGHIRGAEVIPLRQRIRNLTDNQGFRVRYLLSEISKEEMAKKLFSNDKLRRRLVESLNVMELLENVGREAILSLHNSPDQDLTILAWEAVKQMTELITYCNEQFDKISKVYKVQQLRINPETLLYSYYKR